MATPTPTPEDLKRQLLLETFALQRKLIQATEDDDTAEGIAIYTELGNKFDALANISMTLGEPSTAQDIYASTRDEARAYATLPPSVREIARDLVGAAAPGSTVAPESVIPFVKSLSLKRQALQALVDAGHSETPDAIALACACGLNTHQFVGVLEASRDWYGSDNARLDSWVTDTLSYAQKCQQLAGLIPVSEATDTPEPKPAGYSDEMGHKMAKAEAEIAALNKLFRRTGITELDALDATPLKPSFFATKEPVELDVYVRKGSEDGQYFLSPFNDGDCQSIEARCDSQSVAAAMKKNIGWGTTVRLSKKIDKETGKPYFAIVHAEPWSSPDSNKVKVVINTPKGQEIVELSYDKYTMMALNKHYDLIAEKTALKGGKDLQKLSVGDTQTLLGKEQAKAFEALKKNIQHSNMREVYEETLLKIFKDEHGQPFKDSTGKPYEKLQDFLSNPAAAAAFEAKFHEHVAGKTFVDLVAGSLGTKPDGTPRTITYKDAEGVTRTTAYIGHNMGFEDDQQQLPPDLIRALKADPDALFAFVANRQAVRAVINKKAKELAGGKGESIIDEANNQLVSRGLLWQPYDPRDDIVPGLKDTVSQPLSEEKIQQSLERVATELAMINGQKLQEELRTRSPELGLTQTPTVFNHTIPNETKTKEHSLVTVKPGEVRDPSATLDSQINQTDIEIGKSNQDIKDVTDELRKKIEKGQDTKATWVALEAIAGPILKGLEESLKGMDAGYGFF